MEDRTNEPTKIDLSKIKNVEAVEKTEKGFEERVIKKSFSSKKRSNKFNFTEPETIPLPSGGRLYQGITEDTDVLKGYIKMFPMGMKEEEILSTPRFLKTGTATRAILDRCIASNISARDILLFDSNFLMFYLRKISYGDEYEFELTCSNSLCEKKFTHKIDISKLTFEELPEEVIEPIVVKLPRSKYTVKLILPRLFHSEELNVKNANRKKTSEDHETRILDNLIMTTVEILDEDGEEIKKGDWLDFFEALPGMDTAELRDATSFSTGVDRLENVVCPYCETDFSGSVPMGPEFFRF